MPGTTSTALSFLRALVPARGGRGQPPSPAIVELQPAAAAPDLTTEAVEQITPVAGAEPLRLLPEVEKVLLDIGMPPEDSPIYAGKRRSADTPEEAARKFVIWARAIGAVGKYPAGVICALYSECAVADHRIPVSDNRFLFALKHTAGIQRDLADPDRRRRLWTIEPAPVAKPEPAPTPPKTISKPALNKPRLLHRFIPELEHQSHAWVQAQAREARRLGRARKQRGSRGRRAA